MNTLSLSPLLTLKYLKLKFFDLSYEIYNLIIIILKEYIQLFLWTGLHGNKGVCCV